MKMEVSFGTTIVYVGLISIVITWAWRVLKWVWLRPKKLERALGHQGLTAKSYRLVYGDLKESSNMFKLANSKPMNLSHDIAPRVLPFIYQTVENFGKDSFTWIGPTPRVIITNPEQLKDIFNKFSDFRKLDQNPLTKLLAKGVVTYEDEKWVKHRRIINPAFHFQKLEHLLPAFAVSHGEMISEWDKMMISKEGSCELDVWPYLENATADAISRTAFGSSYEEGRRVFQLQREQAQHVNEVSRSVYFPGWRFLPTKKNKRMKEIDKEITASLRNIIHKRKQAMREEEETKDDLLGILLESNRKEQHDGNKKNIGMSTEDVIEECKLFYFAGQETTSVLLAWTMVLLSMYPNWQHRARDEVLQVFGNNKPDFDGLTHLKVVTMIFNEVLRLYPPVVTME